MAIKCGLCGGELQALAGGRCRKCRRLVCAACTASGSAKSPEGMLCRECAQNAAEDVAPAGVAFAPQASRRIIPLWKWVTFFLLLLAIFLLILYFPLLRAKLAAARLHAGGSGAAQAAAELRDMANRPALEELVYAARSGGDSSRLIAIDALASFPGALARQTLLYLSEGKKEPETVRLAAREALAKRRSFFASE